MRARSARRIAYERRGGGRAVVLLHGWCLHSGMWLYLQEDLIADHDVVSVDLPGFGQSADLAGPYSLARHADDVEALVAELALDRPIVVGFAFGAAVALELAARPGAGVAAVVSVAVPDGASSPYGRMPKAMRRDWPEFARRSAEALLHATHSEAERLWLGRMFAQASLAVAIETVGVLAAYDPVPAASRASVPVLFVHADADPVAPVALGERCRAAASRGELAVVADCGHLIVLDRKAEFHAITRAFLASH